MKLNSLMIGGILSKLRTSHTSNVAYFHHALSHKRLGSTNSTEPLVLVEHYNAVTILGLNRPAKRNALSADLLNALQKEIKTFESNESSSVAVLHGTGGNFCAGLDLDELSSEKPCIPLVDDYCTKPVIACLNGYAVGEGFDLAMACDIRIMEETAILGCYNRRFGVPMSDSALGRLSACAGFAFAMDIILSGRPINADEAIQKALVQSVVPCGSGKGNTITYAQSLTKFPQAALLADRAALYQKLSLSDDFQKVIHLERESRLQLAMKVMSTEGKRFFEGIGKHGRFKDLTVQTGWPEWMKK